MPFIVRGNKSNSGLVYQAANMMNNTYTNNNKVTYKLREGQWTGHPCFIIGGGPSLKGFDFNLLEGRKTIGINRAFEFFNPLPDPGSSLCFGYPDGFDAA